MLKPYPTKLGADTGFFQGYDIIHNIHFFMDWIGLDWIGLDWIGLDWIGFDWIGLDWIGFNCTTTIPKESKEGPSNIYLGPKGLQHS